MSASGIVRRNALLLSGGRPAASSSVTHRVDISGTSIPVEMPLNPISTESSPLRSSKSRSILSRLVSPLSSRTRNLSEFYIKPDEPHRQYTPGDVVKGAVVLTVVKPVRVTHLVVRLHGHVRVFKNANASGDDVYHDSGFLTAGRSKRGTESLGNGYATLFDDEITLCGEGRLDVGRYEFNFELDFPAKGVPSSIDVCILSYPCNDT